MPYKVTFLVLAKGVTVTKDFPSLYIARNFANKLRHSKNCKLISTEGFV